jgi:hypothetical protein
MEGLPMPPNRQPDAAGCAVLLQVLGALGAATTRLLRLCDAEDAAFNARLDAAHAAGRELLDAPTTWAAEPAAVAGLQACWSAWREAYVVDADLDAVHQYAPGVRGTLGMHVFVELLRLELLLARPALLQEADAVSRGVLPAPVLRQSEVRAGIMALAEGPDRARAAALKRQAGQLLARSHPADVMDCTDLRAAAGGAWIASLK